VEHKRESDLRQNIAYNNMVLQLSHEDEEACREFEDGSASSKRSYRRLPKIKAKEEKESEPEEAKSVR
jgi:hypothetical protein